MLISWRNAFLALVAVVLIGASFGYGYFAAEHRSFPAHYVERAKSKVRVMLSPAQPEWVARTRTIETIFVRLRLEEMAIPVTRGGAGGGMTSMGENVLLLTHEGTMFGVSRTGMRRIAVRVPNNGIEAYRKAAHSERYRSYTHYFEYLRYNDILYYADGNRAGLVLSYTEWRAADDCYGTTIAHLPLSAEDVSIEAIEARDENAWEVVYRTRPCLPLKGQKRALEGHMAGGRIAYRSPGKILLGSGDYHWDGLYAPMAVSQRADYDHGKILEIDLERRSARHVSSGTRNVQGILIDGSGRTWAVEHGPRGGDELNLIEEGGNYGWPLTTLGTRYTGLPWPGAKQYGRHDDHVAPFFAWVPSIGSSNITQIKDFDPSWDGDLLVASLKARTLFRLRLRDERVVFSEPIEIGERIRYAHQHVDGRIFLLTDSQKLIVVSKDDSTPVGAFIALAIKDLDLPEARTERLRTALAACGTCHSFGDDDDRNAPSLGGVFGRRVSFAADRDAIWTESELRLYLSDPKAYAQGARMPSPNLDKATMVDVIAVLKALSTTY